MSGRTQPIGWTDKEVKMTMQEIGHEMINDLQAHRIARETAALYANAGLRFDVDAHFAVKEIALKEVAK
jgi:hypothetical protein